MGLNETLCLYINTCNSVVLCMDTKTMTLHLSTTHVQASTQKRMLTTLNFHGTTTTATCNQSDTWLMPHWPARSIHKRVQYTTLASRPQTNNDGIFKRTLLVGQWWGKLDESNISYKNSSKDVIMNTSIVA